MGAVRTVRAKYDWPRITALREVGYSWENIVRKTGAQCSPKQLATLFSNRRARLKGKPSDGETRPEISEDAGIPEENGADIRVALIDGETLDGMEGEKDLIRLFKLDPERWEMVQCWVGGKKWDMLASRDTVRTGHSYRMTAQFRLRQEVAVDIISSAWEKIKAEELVRSPVIAPIPLPMDFAEGNPVLFTTHVYDPHLGMLAWGEEVGADYDLKIAESDYVRAYKRLLPLARLYNTEEVELVVGHDLGHAAMYGVNKRGGVTAAGTPQDMDTRMEKIFITVYWALVEAIEAAMGLGLPIQVRFVRGNHDAPEVFRWGVAIDAHFRRDPGVKIIYSPKRLSFRGYGANALMYTHGEEYRRKRDMLPLIMATECPPEIWTASHEGYREILTGHNHILLKGGWNPTGDIDETRAIRTRSLPGLTTEDAWHYEQGYKHHRAATAIAYKRSGGVGGYHEFNPNE